MYWQVDILETTETIEFGGHRDMEKKPRKKETTIQLKDRDEMPKNKQ